MGSPMAWLGLEWDHCGCFVEKELQLIPGVETAEAVLRLLQQSKDEMKDCVDQGSSCL